MNRADGDLRKIQLEALIDKFPAVAYRCRNDEQFTLEYVSGGIAAMTGYPVEEFRSRQISYYDLVLPEDFAAAVATIRAGLHARGHYELTYRIRNAAGEIRWMWDRGVAIKEGEETVVIEGFVVDITDRQRMEHTLKTTDARLNLALQAARLGTWDWDTVTGAVIWSEAHERLWGFAPGSF